MSRTFHLWILTILAGCSPFHDISGEGEAETRKLAAELRAIETKEELQKAVPRLKKRFNRLADLVVEARSFKQEASEPTAASEELFIELARLYEMTGGRELIESAQADAVSRVKSGLNR